MMQAILTLTEQGARVEMSGHAGDERVCMAISTLCCAAMNMLSDSMVGTARYNPGDVYFAVHKPRREDKACLYMLAIGLSELTENFPADLDVTLCGDWDI